MPRDISANLKSHMQGETLTMATCLLIIRKDGVKLGFTTLDAPIVYTLSAPFDVHGAIEYSPINSFVPTSLRTEVGSGVDGLEIEGIIADEDEGIEDNDLVAGMFEGAEVIKFKVNYEALADKELIDFRGYIGEVTIGEVNDKSYKIELRSLTSLQKAYTGRIISPTCTVKRFCDTQCKLVEADFTHAVSVVSVADSLNIVVGPNSEATGRFNYGIVRITSGPNNGLEREVKSSTLNTGNQEIVLKEAFPFALTASVTAQIVEGCDRLPATCKAYNNMINFRGENLLPGTNLITKVVKPPSSRPPDDFPFL